MDSGASNGYRVEEEYVHLDGWRPVAAVRPDMATGMANPKVFPILTDHLGTPRKVLDGDTGEARWEWDAKQPFGHELPNETPTSGLPAFTFDLRFPGQRYDSETGLFHNGFRDYHPGLGRYVQSDPLGLQAGWNTFSYAGMNPMGNMDPYGLDWMNDVSTFIYNTDQAIVQGMANFNMPMIPQSTVDFTAGAGDIASFGLSAIARENMDTNSFVDTSSCSYTAGSYSGVILTGGTWMGGGMAINIGVRTATRALGKPLYHYTSRSSAEAIVSSGGIINPSRSGLHGPGVYVTPFGPKMARLLGAKSVEARLTVGFEGGKLLASPALIPLLPGNFLIRGGVVHATRMTVK